MKQFSILIVDDDIQVCKILQELFCREGYEVFSAHNGQAALDLIHRQPLDLVISDIQMPIMDGFELFRILRQQYPFIKHIMMTSFDIDQYIENIKLHNIGNIFAKGSDFNLLEVINYVRVILSGEIFGLDRYISNSFYEQMFVRSYAQAKKIYGSITRGIPEKKVFFLEIALDELISNAIFHGVLNLSSLPREQWSEDLEVPDFCAVKVTWCHDNEKIGISVEDPRGRLKKQDVLHWLDTYSRSLGCDEHGRGFFLVRQLIDRMIINIDPGNRTECIIIQYLHRKNHNYNKPLLIHEL